MSDDDDNSFSIHDLDHAPEPPSLMEGGANGGMLFPQPAAHLQSPRLPPPPRRRRFSYGESGTSMSHYDSNPPPPSYGGGSGPVVHRLSAGAGRPRLVGMRDRTWSAPPVPQSVSESPGTTTHRPRLSLSEQSTSTETGGGATLKGRRSLSLPKIDKEDSEHNDGAGVIPSSSSGGPGLSVSSSWVSMQNSPLPTAEPTTLSSSLPPQQPIQYGRRQNRMAMMTMSNDEDSTHDNNSQGHDEQTFLTIPDFDTTPSTTLLGSSKLGSSSESGVRDANHPTETTNLGGMMPGDDSFVMSSGGSGTGGASDNALSYVRQESGGGYPSETFLLPGDSSHHGEPGSRDQFDISPMPSMTMANTRNRPRLGSNDSDRRRQVFIQRQIDQLEDSSHGNEDEEDDDDDDDEEDDDKDLEGGPPGHDESDENIQVSHVLGFAFPKRWLCCFGGKTGDVSSSHQSHARRSGSGTKEVTPWWRPNLHQISSCIVTKAPCFWFYNCAWGSSSSSGKFFSLRANRQPTDRAILARLNVLVGFVAIFQVGSALFLGIVNGAPALADRSLETTTEEEREAQSYGARNLTVWHLSIAVYMVGIEAFILVVSAILTVRVVRNVNLVGAIRYLWVLLWVLPFAIFFNIGLYDYFRATDVWVRHYWRDPTMAWYRESFCMPATTANTLCTVPIGANRTEENRWCLANYNSTECSSIRNDAQSSTEQWLYVYYYANASWGLVLICLLFLVVNTLEGIISRPLVQKSRESNVPAWMALPIIGCVTFGFVFTFAETSVLNTRTDSDANFIGPLYLATAGLFFLSAMLGWYISVSSIRNSRNKRNKLIFIITFLVVLILILFALVALFVASIIFSTSFVEIPLTETQRGNLACIIDQSGSCTGCDLPKGDPNRCPEWSTSDVTTVIQTQAKASASLSAIFMIYAVSALRFGWGMRRHIRMYQIEYV